MRRALTDISGGGETLHRRAHRRVDPDAAGGVQRRHPAHEARVRRQAHEGEHRRRLLLRLGAGRSVPDPHAGHAVVAQDLHDLLAETDFDLGIGGHQVPVAGLASQGVAALEHDHLAHVIGQGERFLHRAVPAPGHDSGLAAEQRRVAARAFADAAADQAFLAGHPQLGERRSGGDHDALCRELALGALESPTLAIGGDGVRLGQDELDPRGIRLLLADGTEVIAWHALGIAGHPLDLLDADQLTSDGAAGEDRDASAEPRPRQGCAEARESAADDHNIEFTAHRPDVFLSWPRLDPSRASHARNPISQDAHSAAMIAPDSLAAHRRWICR